MAITLLAAIKTGDQNTAKKILQQKTYSNIDSQSSRNDGTALFWACCQGFIEIVHLLILHGADINKKTSWGFSPLHASVDNNHVDVVRLLLRFGAEVNARTNSGDTPCHLASYRGHSKCVQALAEFGADMVSSNNKHHTPLDEALSMGHYDIYQYLLAVRSIGQKCKSVSSLPSHRPSLEPVWSESCHSTSGSSELTDVSSTGNFSDQSRYSSAVTDNDYNMLKDKLVGVLHLQTGAYFRGETSTSSSLSEFNDLSSVRAGNTTTEPALSFRNIP